jgi:hypothetical protein
MTEKLQVLMSKEEAEKYLNSLREKMGYKDIASIVKRSTENKETEEKEKKIKQKRTKRKKKEKMKMKQTTKK